MCSEEAVDIAVSIPTVCIYHIHVYQVSHLSLFVSQTSLRKRIFSAGQREYLLGAVHVFKESPIYTFKSQFTLHDKY